MVLITIHHSGSGAKKEQGGFVPEENRDRERKKMEQHTDLEEGLEHQTGHHFAGERALQEQNVLVGMFGVHTHACTKETAAHYCCLYRALPNSHFAT